MVVVCCNRRFIRGDKGRKMELKLHKQSLLKIILWGAVVMGMIWIFSLSAQTASESDSLSGQTIRTVAEVLVPGFDGLSHAEQAHVVSAWQHTARKTAHVTLYFMLGLLCMTVLLQYALKMKMRFVTALGIAVGYAITDEIHQLFVPGRGALVSDVFIDAFGALAGVLLAVLVHWLWSRHRNQTIVLGKLGGPSGARR